MKPSNLTTPRQMADCMFMQGYASVRPMAYRETNWQKVAGYALAFVIGVSLAATLVIGLSA